MTEAPKVILAKYDKHFAWEAGTWVDENCGQPDMVRYIRADSPELVELVAAVNDLGRAFDHARMVPRPGSGVCGMTIEANIRGSVYNGVDAWPIAEVRDALAQWEALTK